MVQSAQHAITAEELAARFGPCSPKAAVKKRAEIDRHAARFIAQSPFMVMATASAAGTCDASPKGGPPGFVAVIDPKTLLIPDYPGNRLFDGLRNLLENPHVGLIFMLPGESWTLRVNGRARIRDDAAALQRLRQQDALGRAPQLAVEVTVEECFFHCPKAFIAGDVWNPAKQRRFDDLPALFRS